MIYLFAIALIVSVGVKVTGSLLVGALVIIPPATARLISRDLKRYGSFSMAIGTLSSVMGIIMSRMSRFPAGPSIILIGALTDVDTTRRHLARAEARELSVSS